MPKKGAVKGKGRGKRSKAIDEEKANGEEEEISHIRVATPPPEEDPISELEEDAIDVRPQSVTPESMNDEVEDDEQSTSQAKSKRARVMSNLTGDEQEDVALFLERSDFIYNKRRADHSCASKRNKAWEDLAREMGKDVKSLMTFFESIRTQLGKLRKKKSGQAAVEMTERQEWIWARFQFLMPHIGQVIQRTVQRFRSDQIISQVGEPQEEEPQSAVMTTTPTITPGSSTVTMSNTRRRRDMGTETLDQELQTSKDRQEKLLQILQAPSVPEVPHPERLKFAEYLGHAFQNLPHAIYRDTQKAIFDLLYSAEKQADQESGRSAPEAAHTPQSQQWQPDPSQWQFRPVDPAQSVWHSQDQVWVSRQFPGFTKSPSQQELALQRPPQTPTYITLIPPTESQQPRRFCNDSASEDEQPYNSSETMVDMGPVSFVTPVTETSAVTSQPDRSTPIIH